MSETNDDGSVSVELTKGYFTLIDAVDAEKVSKYRWRVQLFASTTPRYAVSYIGGKTIYLHRFLLDLRPGDGVDHINRNGLDNRRSNLRRCTDAQNKQNRRKFNKKKKTTSTYKGVCWASNCKMWRARVSKDKVTYHLGFFLDELEAAKAYNAAAIKLHGGFVCLNQLPQ